MRATTLPAMSIILFIAERQSWHCRAEPDPDRELGLLGRCGVSWSRSSGNK